MIESNKKFSDIIKMHQQQYAYNFHRLEDTELLNKYLDKYLDFIETLEEIEDEINHT